MLIVPLNLLVEKSFHRSFRVELSTFWPPTATWRLIRDNGARVDGQVSKGDFHWKSPNPLFAPVVAAINGHIRTAVGWTIPELTKALNEDPEVILL